MQAEKQSQWSHIYNSICTFTSLTGVSLVTPGDNGIRSYTCVQWTLRRQAGDTGVLRVTAGVGSEVSTLTVICVSCVSTMSVDTSISAEAEAGEFLCVRAEEST